MEIIQSEKQKGKTLKNNKQSLKDTWTPSKEETERHRKNIQRNNG
jgi:hypothetical protein